MYVCTFKIGRECSFAKRLASNAKAKSNRSIKNSLLVYGLEVNICDFSQTAVDVSIVVRKLF